MPNISPHSESVINDMIHDLKLLAQPDKTEIETVNIEDLQSDQAKSYFKNISHSKPESLLADKFFRPLVQHLGLTYLPEPVAGDGWVDYLIRSLGGFPPVAIELKALHNSAGRYINLESRLKDLVAEYNKTRTNQIIKYLKRSDGFDYVILTNMKDVYYFNREAISDFIPFHKEKIEDFTNSLKENSNIWDVTRRKEDSIPKKELDKLFLFDLEKWANALISLKWNTQATESSILLLNKLMFIRTLEDYGMIPFRYIQSEYENKIMKWQAKGTKYVLQKFFFDIDDWFYQYYDTELFREGSNIFKSLVHEESNLDRFRMLFEEILGVDVISPNFSKGLISYNFRHIDEDVFGKSYESFLAKDRKDQGIYYTHRNITKYLAEKLVEALFFELRDRLISILSTENYAKADSLAEELASISIIDPACGSGPFLINTFRILLEEVYKRIDHATNWAISELYEGKLEIPIHIVKQREYVKKIREKLGIGDDRKLVMNVILRHIYGIDLDPRAIEVAKVNIWKEAVKLAPRAFSFESLTGETAHILPDLEINLIPGDSIITPRDEEVADYLGENFKNEISRLIRIRSDYLKEPFNPEQLSEIVRLKNEIKAPLMEWFYSKINVDFKTKRTVFFPLEFPQLFFDEHGVNKTHKDCGFSGVIGNPPWNNIKPNAKEFASHHPDIFEDKVSKFSMESREFNILFDEKLKNPAVKQLWEDYARRIALISDFISKRYTLNYSGDYSLQKTFLERFIELTKDTFAILIPSTFHTDEGSFNMRKLVLENWNMYELISFENRTRTWFPGVEPRLKFDFILAGKKDRGTLKAKFYVNSWDEIEKKFVYPVELIKRMSPNVLGFVEFRTQKDIDIINKIRGQHKLFQEYSIRITREFDKSNKKYQKLDLFSKKSNNFPLLEGKNIHQYNPNFSKPSYYVKAETARRLLLDRELFRIKKYVKKMEPDPISKDLVASAEEAFKIGKFLLDFETERMIFRRIGRSTDERSIISSMVPANSFLDDSLAQIKPFYYIIEGDKVIQKALGDFTYYLLCLFNSFILDYYLRLRISANLNFFFIQEIPIPEVDAGTFEKLVQLTKGISNEYDKSIRARIEAVVAKDVFKLEKEELEHILGTFIYGHVDSELLELIKTEYDLA